MDSEQPSQPYKLRPEAALLIDLILKFFGFVGLGFKAIIGMIWKKKDEKVTQKDIYKMFK